MRILHFTPMYVRAGLCNGVVRALKALTESLVAYGHEVTVFTTTAGTSLHEFTQECVNGVEVNYFRVSSTPFIWSSDLLKILPQEIGRFDIVHVSAMWHPIAVPICQAARRRRVPYVISVHGGLNRGALRLSRWKKEVYWRMAERRNFTAAAAIHFTAEAERREAYALRSGLPARAFVIPNPVVLPDVPSDDDCATFRRRYGVAAYADLLLFVGRVHQKKGLEFLIKALAKDELKEAVLMIVGPLTERAHVRRLLQLAQSLDVVQRVRFTGPLFDSDLWTVYKAADVFALTSYGENFGMAVLEAMACGTPVLVSDRVNIAADLEREAVAQVVP